MSYLSNSKYNLQNLRVNSFGFYFGLLASIYILIFPVFPESAKANSMLAAAILMASWWMTEALPLAATSLLPIAIFPILGITSGSATAGKYFNSTIFIFIGGFIIALAMQKWNLHKRISLKIINAIGSSPIGIISGFMIASWFLSMFISNVATTVMMLPIGLAVIIKMKESLDEKNLRKFSIALMLGIAYSSSVGGIATLVGTAPNLAFQSIYKINFPDNSPITFASWLKYGMPISIVMFIAMWFVLNKWLYRIKSYNKTSNDIIKDELAELGKTSFEEKTVLLILISTSVLWLLRKPIDFGGIVIPGWSDFVPFAKFIDDGTVAIFMSIILFIIPARNKKESTNILTADIFFKIPWDVILIFGGGFALAHGFSESGLSELLGKKFEMLSGINNFLLVVIIAFSITFLTELTSNTATTYTVLPILAAVAISININPLYLMLPATISASFAFMLPVATPPNAIVFGSGYVRINQMVRTGIILNIIGAIIVSVFIYIFI